MTNTWLIYDTESGATTAEALINANSGFPNTHGTLRWSGVKYIDSLSKWGFPKPQGSHGFTQEQQMQGVTFDDELEYNAAWFPSEEEE